MHERAMDALREAGARLRRLPLEQWHTFLDKVGGPVRAEEANIYAPMEIDDHEPQPPTTKR